MFLWIAAVQVIGYAEVQTRDKTSCLLLTVDFVFLIHVKFLSKCTSPVGLQDLVEHCTSEFCLKHFFWNVKKKLNFLPLLECKYFSFFTDYSHLCYIGNRVGFRAEKALLCSAAIKRFLTAEFPFHIGLPLLHFHAKCHAYCTKPNLHQRRKKKKKQKLNCGLERMHLRAESYATPKLFFLYFYFFNVWSLTKHQECIMYFNNVWLAHMVPINWALGCLRSDVRPQIFTASNLCHAGMHSKWHLSILQEMDAIMNSELFKHSLLQLHISISNW